ncbi:MAG: cell division protein FtsL [Thermoanaerobacteraceae bacterium]|nr:cell division protein FtsL [Thermoanaerobacteraceae bacterium]
MIVEAREKLYLPPQPTAPETRPKRKKALRRGKVVTVSLILAAFVLGLLWTSQSIGLVLKGYELNRLKKEISTLQQANERLQLEVARLKSPEHVAQVATTRLGMVKPTSQDIRFLPSSEEEPLQVAQEHQAPPEPSVDHHALWRGVAQAIQHWLGINPAQAAQR